MTLFQAVKAFGQLLQGQLGSTRTGQHPSLINQKRCAPCTLHLSLKASPGQSHIPCARAHLCSDLSGALQTPVLIVALDLEPHSRSSQHVTSCMC